ncbi:MAG: response regulator [Candidatus Eisenbacteria bacterium]|uniref:histidine kinase n=1 Tax=Eiseniibacteriota bacterium TaxID=2212470 RepID=A0A933SBY7_UNCEI|nr:response regulator [Candidatus Eisenbacteria bacterium]
MPLSSTAGSRSRVRPIGRFALTLIAVLVAAAALFEFLLLPRVRRDTVSRVEHEMAMVLEVRRGAIERWIIDGMADAKTVASFPSSRALVNPASGHEIDREFTGILNEFARQHEIASIGVFDSLSRLRASTTAHRFADEAWSSLRYPQPGRGDEYVAFVALSNGEPTVAIRVPVAPGGGHVYTTHTPQRWLTALLASSALPIPGAQISLVERTREGDRVMLGRVPAVAPGERLLRRETSIPGSAWYLEIAVPESKPLAGTIARMRGWELGTLAFLAAITALVHALAWGQRRAIEAAVQRSRARFSLLLEHANDAILFLDDNGVVLRCNQRAEEFYGVASGGLTGLQLARDLTVTGPPTPLTDGLHEAVHRTAGGSATAVEVSAKRAEAGERTITVALVRDVQQRIEQERRLLRLNRNLRTAAAVGAAAMREDDEARLIDESVALVVAHGGIEVAAVAVATGPESLRWAARAHAPGAADPGLALPDALAHEAIASAETVCRTFGAENTPPGEPERAWLQAGVRAALCVPVRVSGRQWGAVLLLARSEAEFEPESRTLIENVVRDVGFAVESIGERTARRELEATLQALFESGPVGIAVMDPGDRLTEANHEFLRIIGRSHDEVVSGAVNWMEFCTCMGADGRPMPCTFSTPFETDFTRADGSRIGVFVGRVHLAGEHARSIAVVLDLSAQRATAESLRQTQQQLIQSQKLETIGRLAGGVAHDFNNLLTVIQGYTQIVQSAGAQTEADAAALSQVLRAADRAASLTRQMLAFSRQQVLEPRVLDLGQVLTDTEKMIRRLIGEDVEIVLRLPGNLGLVKADPVQVEQVLLNLVVNARDAMPHGGHLTLEVANFDTTPDFLVRHPEVAPGAYVLLTVSDDGEGMPPDVVPRIFEPFFTTKEPGKGTGLGLATVYGIVRQSGGTIWVRSALHEGSSFHVLLPRVFGAQESAATPSIRPHGRGERVLVVEDDDMVRPITVAMLERLGYRTLAAASGEDALRLCRDPGQVVDLLLSDVVMRGMNGPELASEFRRVRPGTPVLFVTGYTHDSATIERLSAGGAPYLPKPFSLDALGQGVRRALGSRAQV